jgi:hypothetical protein
MSTHYPEATILGTHVREFRSSTVGQDYEISVLLPNGYTTSQDRYPVLYLLDGNIMMACLGSLVPLLLMQKAIPELIVVGIGNPLQSVEDWNAHRCRDYTPIADDTLAGSRGGQPFFRFVSDELIPFIDAEYRTDPTNRTLFGYSLSGLYVVYALLQQLFCIRDPLAVEREPLQFQLEAAGEFIESLVEGLLVFRHLQKGRPVRLRHAVDDGQEHVDHVLGGVQRHRHLVADVNHVVGVPIDFHLEHAAGLPLDQLAQHVLVAQQGVEESALQGQTLMPGFARVHLIPVEGLLQWLWG